MIKYILTFAGGLIVGGAAGYFIGEKIIKDKCDKYIDDEIEKILTEVRTREDNVIRSEDLAKLNDDRKSSIDISKPYSTETKVSDIKVDELPFELPPEKKVEEHNIWDDYDSNEPDEEPDDDGNDDIYPSRDLPPSLISKEEYDNDFNDENDAWDKSELILFTDNVLAELKRAGEYIVLDSGECMNILGQDIFTDIMAHNYLENQDHKRCFVRNNRLRIDFMITKSGQSYKQATREEGD